MGYPRDPKTIGDHIKKRRHELQMRQIDVALHLGVDEYTVCNWENNKTTPAVRFMPHIMRFLGYDPFAKQY